MKLGPQHHNKDGLLGPNSITVVYMEPLGNGVISLSTIESGGVVGRGPLAYYLPSHRL